MVQVVDLLVRDHRVEKRRGDDQKQHSIGQLSRLLGRPKCFSGREEERHGWSLKFGATAATLSDHASVCG